MIYDLLASNDIWHFCPLCFSVLAGWLWFVFLFDLIRWCLQCWSGYCFFIWWCCIARKTMLTKEVSFCICISLIAWFSGTNIFMERIRLLIFYFNLRTSHPVLLDYVWVHDMMNHKAPCSFWCLLLCAVFGNKLLKDCLITESHFWNFGK